jgi:endonuclease G, mitochondrial
VKQHFLKTCAALFAFLLFAGAGYGDFTALEEALPAHGPRDEIVAHTAYTLKYDEKYEQADWVAYILTAERAAAKAPRKGNFRPDPDVPTGSATPEDYRGSGYDRGHLAPAADMKWSPRVQSESFYMSNMSPQVPAFNQGIWNDLEEQVRRWASENGELYIVTGPVLSGNLPTIGPDRVAVPRYYYKVVLDYHAPDFKAIGFIMPNAGSDQPLAAYAVTVDSVQSFTGIDFFPALPDSLERAIEGTIQPAQWHLPGGVQVAGAQTSAPSGTVADSASAPRTPPAQQGPSTRQILLAIVVLVVIALIVWVLLVTLGEAFGLFRRRR